MEIASSWDHRLGNQPVINTNNNQLQDQNTHNSIFDIQNETPSTQFLTISKSSEESTSIDNGRFFHFESFDIRPHLNSENLDYAVVDDGDAADDDADHDNKDATTGVANDKARYNLATRVMSNGVEVIIAGDKNGKISAKPNILRILPSLSRKPMTLAPSTLKDQMILVMPSNAQETYIIPIDSKHFITKTCLTTYTYRTTYLQDGKTTVESREKVVSNTATEERNYLKIKPTETLGITLSRTPELAVGVFHTTYTYYNTILNGELSIVVSSQHVLMNTITGPDDYISFLQPSEEATPVLETNTYFSKISLTKTLKESDFEKIVSTSNILTQVIVTESLQPPQSSSIITSYVAFDIDETTIKENSASASSLKPYNQLFQTYSYYTVDEKVENKKPGTQNGKIPDYEKIETLTTSTSSTSLALKLAGSLQTDLHIYATKTYLTTFTYFTTLMNTNENDNIDSSTVVSFHTRVIENVITESIPSFIINTDLLSAFETQLKNPLNHNSFVTMVTLSGGQSLEITAMNMLHPSLSYKKNQVTKSDTNVTQVELSAISSDTQLPFENSNEIFDSDVASSENEELLADQYLTAVEFDTRPIVRNNTKTAGATTDFPSVNQLIGSFSLNRLQALGPVFNAMAGLIQNNLNNFGTNPYYELKKNSSILSLEGKQAVKNISAYSSNSGSFEQSHDGPIYIPVQSLPNENLYLSTEKIKISGPHQNLHISPPETSSWFIDSKLNRVKLESEAGPSLGISKPKYETPLLNSGIPISPGEVITANSDVIVGKPNGIQPRVPYNNKVSDVVNPLVPPPSIPPMTPYSYQFQYQAHIKASPSPIPLSESSLNFDGILKPPSMKPQSMQNQHQHQNKKLIPPHGLKNANYRAHYATSHMHQPSQHYTQQTQQQRIPMPHLPQNNQVQWLLNAQRPKPMPNYIPYTPYDYDQQHPPSRDKNNDRHPSNLSNFNNEILEIKRIPEVYSTDLPASEMTLNNSSQSKNPSGIYKAFVKRIINSDKPMLVDIQPSKITNIVIPRDNSASILVVESSVELHKNGQYYDEPTTYTDAFMTGSVAIASSSANQPRKPILSNQQINLDTNVLSHNVDINAPPITFKKDAEFPHSTPVRGHIQKNEQFPSFKMPHITIPLTDNQIQVNLTPQNVITQNSSAGHFVNDLHTVFNNKASVDNLQLELVMEKATQTQSFYDNKINHQPEQRPVLEHLKPLESSYFDGINAQIKPNSASFQHFNKTYYPYPNVIPLRSNIEFSNSSIKSPIQRPVPFLKPQKYQETLQIFAKANPTPIQQSQSASNKEEIDSQSHRPPPTMPPVSDHVPLVNLFYDPSNDGNKYFSNSGYFTDKMPPPTSSHSHHHHQNYPTDSNPFDDQKPSSSLNIGVPVSQREENFNFGNNDRDEDYTILESQIKKPTPTTDSILLQMQPHPPIIQPATTNKFIPHQPSPSTINQMDDLYIENQLPPPSVQNYTGLLEQPSPGRPFSQLPSRISTKMPNLQNSTNISRVIFNNGQGFKLQHVQDQIQNEFFQQTHPVDSVTDDSDNKQYKNKKIISSHQTEAPFNPKYTKRTKKPPRTDISISSAMTSDSPTTTQLLNLNQMEVLNKPSTVNEANSNGNISFNHHRESSEIFDFHESINSHNYKFIHTNEATPTTKTSKDQLNLYSSTDTMMTHQRPASKNTKTRYQLLSEPSTDMKPPSPSPELSPIKPQTERVLGLNPPPPPPSPKISVPLLAQIPIASFSSSASANNFDNYSQLPEKTFQSPVVVPHVNKTTTTINPLKKPNRPFNSSPFTKYNYNTSRPHTKLKSKPKTNSKPNYTTAKTTKPTRAQNDNSSSSAVSTTTKSISLSQVIPKSTTQIVASVSSSSFSSSTSTSAPSSSSLSKKDGKIKLISPTLKEDDTVFEKSSSNVEKSISNQDSSMLNHEIPEEILIEGSEKHHHRQSQFTDSRFIENQTETRTKPFSILIDKEVIPVGNYQNHSKLKQTQASSSELGSDLNHFNSRTQARTTGPAIIPTKYITKPHYLTVTTTKLSISTSLGVPVTHSLTLTLTETKTSTLVDTVTETHTLLQPTRVTESHTTTATQIIHFDDYHQQNHQYRLGSKIKPTIEVVNNVLLTSSELSASETVPTLIPVVVASTSTSVSTSTRTVEAISNTNSNITTQVLENNSIFVVMTDKNSQGGVFSIGPSMMDTPQNINAIGVGGERDEVPFISEIPSSIELDYDYNITFDYLPTRDEEAETNEVNHVLLGGVLIATPPKSSDNNDGLTTSSATCRPSCKSSRNELCQQINNRMQCLCRPGFARMFPDRPCRPTYTYSLEIPIHRINSQILHFNNQFRSRDSDDFKQLADITHNAVDRMVMQSDLRDVYHGVHVTSFDVTDSPEAESGILGKFLIQLSDNSDEKRLVDVFKKYLRQNGFSLGGTEIFTTKDGINSLQVNDFNECAHSQFHDCSENSRCFNLQGTYTCSCQEGFADLSENSIYPGRICSAEVIGCEKCHFHGKCVQTNKTNQPLVTVCECFSWYTGASCQLNLKIVLIALMTIGTILFILLLFCVLVTCTRRRDNHSMPSFMSGMQIIAPKNTGSSAKNLTIEKRAMIKDSSSEGSHNSLPYVLKRDVENHSVVRNTNHHMQIQHQYQHQKQKRTKIINQRGHPSSALLISSFSEIDYQRNNFPEQNDRSLTVMIPRAKYHHSVLAQTLNPSSDGLDMPAHNNENQLKIVPSDTSGSSSNASTFQCSNEKMTNNSAKQSATVDADMVGGISLNHGALQTKSTGALVSAGFEVSATVGSIQQQQSGGLTANMSSRDNKGASQLMNSAPEINFHKFNYNDAHLQYNNYKDGEKFIDSMDVWIDTIQQNELAAEARSFNETTILSPTKSLRCVYERQLSQSNGNDEANTMAERDIGSTCLLPHTHLYKPDRDSDVSGFDSF